MSHQETILRVAQRTQLYAYRLWGYGEAIAMDALLEAARTTGQADFAHFVQRTLELWMLESPKISNKDHVAPGRALLGLYEQQREENFLDRAIQLADHLVSAPRSRSGAHVHRPEQNEWIWVDCIYTDGPFLAKLARLTGQSRYRAAAVEYALKYAQALQDPADHLFYHGRDDKSGKTTPYYWGRGNGWALMGLVDLIAELESHVDGYQEISNVFRRLIERMKVLQDNSGDWHTILNYPESCLEPSISAMFTAAIRKAMQHKLVPGEYREPLERAWTAVQKHVQIGGQYPVSEATAVGDYMYYNGLPQGIYPWGQGPALLALCRMGCD